MSTNEERFNDLVHILKRIKKQYHNVLVYSNDPTRPNAYSPVKDAFDKFLALADKIAKDIETVLHSSRNANGYDIIYSTQLSTLYETIAFANNASPFFSEETYAILDEMESFVKEEMRSFNANFGL